MSPGAHPAPSDRELNLLAATLGERLMAKGLMLATAESCTGGWIAKCLTDIAGSSAWLACGLVTYSNAAKQALLGVDAAALAQHGAVSEPVVRQMVTGVLAHSEAGAAVSVSGVAGPAGGSAEKPVGMVCFGFALPAGVRTETMRFFGDRDTVRRRSVAHALTGLIDLLDA